MTIEVCGAGCLLVSMPQQTLLARYSQGFRSISWTPLRIGGFTTPIIYGYFIPIVNSKHSVKGTRRCLLQSVRFFF